MTTKHLKKASAGSMSAGATKPCAPSMNTNLARQIARLLKLAQRAGAGGLTIIDAPERSEGITPATNATVSVAIHDEVKDYWFPAQVIEAVLARQLLCIGKQRNDGVKTAMISEVGRAALARLIDPENGFQAQHRDLSHTIIETEDGRQGVTRNEAESPLARLARRNDARGKPFLTPHEFAAGERLRLDFERAGLMPRVSANWEASVASRGRAGSATGEISDFALDARQRFEQAVDVLGPELSGAVVDICCFLKGFESVERERRWPPRSAKLMLRAALQLLVRHYGLVPGQQRADMRSWGTADYRPSL